MLSSSRSVASFVRWLRYGAVASFMAAAVLCGTLVSCKDESQPEYWIEKLEDPSWRPRSIKRLEQFFEDTMTRSGNLKAPAVQEFVNKTIEPLTKTYTQSAETLDTKSRVALIKLLAAYRDKRAESALKRAFEDFAKQPSSSKEEQDIKWAARAAGDLKLESLSDPMLQTFLKLRASTMLGGIVYRDLNEAMLELPSKAWVGPLVSKLDAEIETPKAGAKPDVVDAYRDQLFWQTTSADLLGRIGDPAAVEPLIRVMLDPSKVDAHPTAVLALVKLGKPSVDVAVQLLTGKHEKLIAANTRRIKELTGSDPKDRPYVLVAAIIIGTGGRADGAAALIEALKNETDDVNKAVIARELAKLPGSEESKQAFKRAFESIALDAIIPPGQAALPTLAESAGQFFDSSLLEWLLERADKTQKAKGSDDDKKALQGAALVTSIKLSKLDQLPAVKKALDKYGTKLEKDIFTQAERLLKTCVERVQCYMTAFQKAENQERSKQFLAIKAGYMLAILGNEQTRDELANSVDPIENAAVRFMAAQVIDKLSPKGSREVASKLKTIIDKNAASPDRDKAMGDAPLKQVMYRLEARAR